MATMHEEAHRCVVRVSDGRGFVVQGELDDQRYIVTASHCLPRLPPRTHAGYIKERTYKASLAPLGNKSAIWAECLFVDPVADIAVLGSPDGQSLSKEPEAYQELVNGAEPVPMRPCQGEEEGWLFAQDASHWFRCTVRGTQKLWIADAAEPIRRGMSGSPILAADGTAIGIVCVGKAGEDDEHHTEGGPNAGYWNLPGWLLHEFAHKQELAERA
jgi:hypothetical protein